MKKYLTQVCAVMSCLVILASCATHKAANGEDKAGNNHAEMTLERQMLTFVQKVYDRQLHSKNVVGNMSCTINADGKELNVPGSLHMRKDEVIRLQLFVPILGSEVGRIEFTPDRVLLMDRMHKEYVEARYDQLGFLQANGLSFYSLQALFWNQLLMPGKEHVGEADLTDYHVDLAAIKRSVSLKQQPGKISYLWDTEKANGQITAAHIGYATQDNNSRLDWTYSNFTPVGLKSFPTLQDILFTIVAGANRHTLRLTLNMSEVTTNDKWESRTTVSSKFKKVDAEEILKKISQIQ
jgi:hypothetical protein